MGRDQPESPPPFVTGEDRDDLREKYPLTWMFHRNTSRWTFNSSAPKDDDIPLPGREHLQVPYVTLPAATLPSTPLREAIDGRYSCRRFGSGSLTLLCLSTLLHAAYGIKGRSQWAAMEFLERTVPSGGGMYPMEIYAIVDRVDGLPPGLYHYVPVTNGLERLREVTLPRPVVSYLFMGQSYVGEAAATLLVTAVLDRSLRKYGDRGYRYVLLEAGHIVQNVNLVAAAMSLGSCNLGGFFDNELGALLMTDVSLEVPLYGVAVGVADDPERERARQPREPI